MLNAFAKTMLLLSFSGSLIAAVLLILKPFIRSRVSKGWYYYVWVIVIVRLVLPYGLPIPLIDEIIYPITNYAIADSSDNVDIAMDFTFPKVINESEGFHMKRQAEIPIPENTSKGFEASATESVSDPIKKGFYDYFQSLSIFSGPIWLSISLLLIIKQLLSYNYFVRFIQSGIRLADDEAVLKSSADACRSIGIKKPLPVFTHPNISSPMLIGLLKPIIVLPEMQLKNMLQLKYVKYVFMHELTHYKRFDIFYKWLMQIVLCLHWFNPVIYLVAKEVNTACELSCDEAVIKRLSAQEQRSYGDTLLRSLELSGRYNNSAVSLTLAENSKLMKERLRAIMKYHGKSKLAAFISSLLTIVLCTGAAFTGSQAAIISGNKEINPLEITNSSSIAEANNIQNVQPVSNTAPTAHTFTGESTALSHNTNEIKIDIPRIDPGMHKSYGPYVLKKGDVVSSDLTWSNDEGGLYFAIGEDFGYFKGFYSDYGWSGNGNRLKRDITVQTDGEYYIFVGNPSTLEPDVKNVSGIITTGNSAKVSAQGFTDADSQRTRISVSIPSVTGLGFVESYGRYFLSEEDNILADIIWQGSGYVMLLYTKENLSTDDIASLIDNGVLPLGGTGNFLGDTEIISDTAYKTQEREIVYNLTASADEISKTMSVPSEGDYYFYVIARSDTEIINIAGDIVIAKKANKTGGKLPRMNTWIGSAGEIETPTGIIYNSKNFTGDRINYEFSSVENGSRTINFNSSLTGDYEIIFISSDRTIIEKIPPFTGNKQITLSGLPKDTISMIVYSMNVSGSLSVDILEDAQASNKLANSKFVSASNSYLYEGGAAANNFQYGNPFPAQKGDTVTIFLTDELSGWQLDKDKITIKIVIGGNDGTTQEVILSNAETEKTITIKENANHHITIHNTNNQLVNYSFTLLIKTP